MGSDQFTSQHSRGTSVSHPALTPDSVAVITGGAAGIGLAAATRFARLGLRVCIADLGDDRLSRAAEVLSAASPGGASNVLTVAADVSRVDEVQHLEAAVRERFGGIDILMNNAGVQPGSRMFGPVRQLGTQCLESILWGVINGSQVFAPRMIDRGRPGLIINTGSKQGITTPPGDPAYNVAKAGVKVFTEALQHELRNTPDCKLSAHLLIPGFVFTGLTAKGRTEKPAERMDARTDRRFHDRAAGGRGFLHPMPRQRCAQAARRASHSLGRRRHRREPPGTLTLASGLRAGLRRFREKRIAPQGQRVCPPNENMNMCLNSASRVEHPSDLARLARETAALRACCAFQIFAAATHSLRATSTNRRRPSGNSLPSTRMRVGCLQMTAALRG